MLQCAMLRGFVLAALMVGLLFSGTCFATLSQTAEKENLAYMPATEQIKRFKAGTLSPVDVLNAQMEQIKKHNGPLNTSGKELENYMAFNGKVNAITYEHFDEAMTAAKESEKRYKTGTARPLEGITVSVKDEFEVKGWRTTQGAVAYQDMPPAESDSPLIEMLREAGAVLHIQTTVPELFLNSQTWTKLWGVTRNPWNLAYAVGGSTGGGGAALAAGFTTLSTGSDIGGSIRIPSAYGGLYGFKPPFGRVPTSDTSFESYGPLARTFEDMVLMQNVITGPHPRVHSSMRPKLDYPESYEGLRGVKIAVDYCEKWNKQGMDPSVREAMHKAVDVLRTQGAIVDEVLLGWSHEVLLKPILDGMIATGSGASMVLEAGKHKNPTSYAQLVVNTAKKSEPETIVNAEAFLGKMQEQVQREVFGKGYTALIMPTLSTPYTPAEFDPTKLPNPETGLNTLYMVLTYPWNMLSRYPVVNVPIAIAPNNVPVGMQVVGNTYDDLVAFRVAAGYAKAGVRLYTGDKFPDFRSKQ